MLEEAGKLVLHVPPGPPFTDEVARHICETHDLIQLSNRQKTGIRRYLRAPELQPQMAVEMELQSSVFTFTHRVSPLGEIRVPTNPFLITN